MIGLEDRQTLARDIEVAHAGIARLRLACAIAGIDARTLQRWQAREGLTAGDCRPRAVRPMPNHALSQAERAQLLAVANEPRLAKPCRPRSSCPCWPTRASTWPASPASHVCCARRGRPLAARPGQGTQGRAPADHEHRRSTAAGLDRGR